MSLSAAQALPLISKYESGGRNVVNQPLPGAAPSTASGYYQIVNGTWQQFAPQAGVDLTQYPTALSAPQDVQSQVAATIYNKQGFGPWSSNTQLMADPAVSGSDPNSLFGLQGGTADENASAATGGMSGVGEVAGQAAKSLLDPLWEIVSRGLLVVLGVGLVLIALAAMLFQSKTVQVAARDVMV